MQFPQRAGLPPVQPVLPLAPLPRLPPALPPPRVQLPLDLSGLLHHPVLRPCHGPTGGHVQVTCLKVTIDLEDLNPRAVSSSQNWTVAYLESLLPDLLKTGHPAHFLVLQVKKALVSLIENSCDTPVERLAFKVSFILALAVNEFLLTSLYGMALVSALCCSKLKLKCRLN